MADLIRDRPGYAPDAFGHIGQLLQILQGFGIGSAIVWRGLGDEGEELGSEFWWAALNGSRVLAVHLRESYSNQAVKGSLVGNWTAKEGCIVLVLRQGQILGLLRPVIIELFLHLDLAKYHGAHRMMFGVMGSPTFRR